MFMYIIRISFTRPTLGSISKLLQVFFILFLNSV